MSEKVYTDAAGNVVAEDDPRASFIYNADDPRVAKGKAPKGQPAEVAVEESTPKPQAQRARRA